MQRKTQPFNSFPDVIRTCVYGRFLFVVILLQLRGLVTIEALTPAYIGADAFAATALARPWSDQARVSATTPFHHRDDAVHDDVPGIMGR
jgi:hypothetical protein